jgi:putative two-component system response regulator
MSSTVLVVDDDPDARCLLSAILQAEGYSVHTECDGASALAALTRLQPDVVLLDVVMPDADGVELCRRIKENPETRLTPLLLVTALSAQRDRVRGLEAGADGFLSKPIDSSELLARVRSLCQLKAFTDELDRPEAALFALALSIEGRDSYTAGHCERLSAMSVELGLFLGLPDEQIHALRRAGIVHDIGKVAIPDSILLKPGPLTAEEWEIMRQHPLVGERICSPLRSLRLVLPIIRHHHERFDGSGYPDHLADGDIPLTARVLQIVDIFDAMTTDRPYKKAISPAAALVELGREAAAGRLDPDLHRSFIDLFERAPFSSRKG